MAVGVTEEAFLLRVQGGAEGAVFGIGGGVNFGYVWCVGHGEVVQEVLGVVEFVDFDVGGYAGVAEGVEAFAGVAHGDEEFVSCYEHFLGAAVHGLAIRDVGGGNVHADHAVGVSCREALALEGCGAFDMGVFIEPGDALHGGEFRERRGAAQARAQEHFDSGHEIRVRLLARVVQDELEQAARLGHDDEFLRPLAIEWRRARGSYGAAWAQPVGVVDFGCGWHESGCIFGKVEGVGWADRTWHEVARLTQRKEDRDRDAE